MFPLLMIESQAALASGNIDASYRFAMDARSLDAPNPEVPALAALRAAIAGRDADRIREVSQMLEELPGSGTVMLANRRFGRAALAAVEGRVGEAIADFRAAYTTIMEVGLRYHAAMMAVGAVTLLGPLAELRPVISEARAVLESVRARTWVDRLDEAVAVQPAAVAPTESRSQIPAE